MSVALDGSTGLNSTGSLAFKTNGTTLALTIDTSQNTVIEATKKLYLDGASGVGGDTYLVETSANQLDFYAGAANTFRLSATAATVTGSVAITNSSAAAAMQAKTTHASANAAYIWASHVTYAGTMMLLDVDRAATSSYDFFSCRANGIYQLNLTGDGRMGLGIQNTTSGAAFMVKAKGATGASNAVICRKSDDTGWQWYFTDDGGLSNYQANNVNLSSRVVKNSYRSYTESELESYIRFLEAVDYGVWKYNDQDHDDWNHGPTAEGVRDALRTYSLEDEAGSLLAEFKTDDEPLLALHHHDLNQMAIATLIHSNKRLRERVAALENRR